MCGSALRRLGIKEVIYGCASDRIEGYESVLRTNIASSLQAIGGYMREEAVIILPRFYITENMNALAPKLKANHVLKTGILP
ncbi:hypothetical protein ARMGADRAFT_1079860 [Armillaria gallica]|uniref:CMP/dCMP-type deaminase domain-containing protein n=1 Tax=Armillaria gallica TaxID=47427 RepID=A0A2H3DQ07_ARMGA|nr:hypothetical protein ARMGADRAFT_1079860 [Armillaria gallica]